MGSDPPAPSSASDTSIPPAAGRYRPDLRPFRAHALCCGTLFLRAYCYVPSTRQAVIATPIIMTVDDDPQVLAAIARDLRRQYGKDYRILRASSGAEGLEALEALKERGGTVSLLLSDQRMPSMNGVEFLTRARTLFPSAKRALLTAYSDTEAAISAINASHVDYYFVKPWDPPEDKLYPIIDGLLDDWHLVFRPGFDGIKLIADR